MVPKNILLAFQLENYKILRFLKFIYSHPKFWISGSKRQKLEYTSKAKLLLLISAILFFLDVIFSFIFLTGYILFGSLLLTLIFIPIYFISASIIIFPLDSYLKRKIVNSAKKRIQEFPNLKIIAITGSMGKTTTKEFLATILGEKYNVLATQGTKNTPLGISQLILSQLHKKHEVFIVEMGAYNKGNITELCDIVGPNISIITGITLQHLERFGSLDEIIDTKFEIIQALGKNGFAVIDTSTTGAQKGLNEKQLDVKNIVTIQKGTPFTYKENLSGIEFKIEGENISTKILSNYIVETLQICWEIAKYLGMNISDFKLGVEKIDFVPHRMQLLHNKQSNVYVVDDSFNGNIEGIGSILHLMQHAPFSGRKILIAGGVVELGEMSEDVNSKLGRQMGQVADMILLVEGPVGNAIAKGLSESGYTTNKIRTYQSPLSLHDDLKNITKSGDMIIFQNDLPDHYL